MNGEIRPFFENGNATETTTTTAQTGWLQELAKIAVENFGAGTGLSLVAYFSYAALSDAVSVGSVVFGLLCFLRMSKIGRIIVEIATTQKTPDQRELQKLRKDNERLAIGGQHLLDRVKAQDIEIARLNAELSNQVATPNKTDTEQMHRAFTPFEDVHYKNAEKEIEYIDRLKRWEQSGNGKIYPVAEDMLSIWYKDQNISRRHCASYGISQTSWRKGLDLLLKTRSIKGNQQIGYAAASDGQERLAAYRDSAINNNERNYVQP